MAYFEYRPTKTQFHYTSENGFFGILSSREIWLSDLRSTNDPREIEFGWERLKKALIKTRHETFAGAFGLPISLMSGRIAGYLKRGTFLSASLSPNGDSLPMWREYGASCEGLAIGFRPRALLDMPVRVQQVNYVDGDDVENLSLLLDELFEPIVRQFSETTTLPDSVDQIVLTTNLVSQVIASKHRSWEYEQETRLSHAVVVDHEESQVEGEVIPASQLRDGSPYFTPLAKRYVGDSEVDYASLPFGKYANGVFDGSRAIEIVVVGPKCHLSLDHVENELSKNGFQNVTVVRSECQIN